MKAMCFLVCVVAAATAGACVSEPGYEVTRLALDDRPEWEQDDEPGSDEKDDDDPEPDPEPEPGDCPPEGCGDNSPVVDGIYFGQLHLWGLANSHDVMVVRAETASSTPITLELVDRDRLRGVDAQGGVVAEHQALVGVRIIVRKGEGPEKVIRIARVGSTQHWVGTHLPIETYEFQFEYLQDNVRYQLPLCSKGTGDATKVNALVFGHELYDPETKNITPGSPTDGWVNIACKGSAVYKMHKIGYTRTAQGKLGIWTTQAQRRAMFNAWTANVCGDGYSFTQAGEKITLRESLNILPADSMYLVPTRTYEAIWDEHGAVCLNTPRLADKVPTILHQIQQRCGQLPTCDSTMLNNWQHHGYVLVGNPYPPSP
jgi:hypothetical protein